MGCTTSKQAHLDLRRSPSPLRRSHSVPSHLKPNPHQLTSSTLGPLELDTNSDEEIMKKHNHDKVQDLPLPAELVEAKAWSDKMNRRIPRTPTVTPPNEPETINAWELMADLEDTSTILPSPALDRRSFSFFTTPALDRHPDSIPSSGLDNEIDFDPKIISNFRKALDQLSPQHPILLLRSPDRANSSSRWRNLSDDESIGTVRARVRVFQERIDAKKANAEASKAIPSVTEGKVVVYFTSLRGVRKTYDDCCWVKEILRGYGVRADERDVSMDRGFREELRAIVGAEGGGGGLPRVFADGRCLGGAEEVRRMHETGELGKAIGGCEMVSGGGACEGCGDVRFMLCGRCSGSCKVYVEEEEGGGGFRPCVECNENGIVRCPICCRIWKE